MAMVANVRMTRMRHFCMLLFHLRFLGFLLRNLRFRIFKSSGIGIGGGNVSVNAVAFVSRRVAQTQPTERTCCQEKQRENNKDES